MILKNGKRIDGCTDTLPVGTVQPFLGLTPPLGYLVCQGQLVSKAEYPELYKICGDAFGTSTSTHFYLPDLRGKTIAGYDSSKESMNSIGKLIGAETHRHLSPLTWVQKNGEYFAGVTNSLGSEWVTGSRDFYGGVTNEMNDTSTGLAENGWTVIAYYTSMEDNYQPTITMNWIVKAAMLIPEYFKVDNTLTSTSTANALSAAQGKILNDKFNNYLLTSKVVDNLTSSDNTSALSANQGRLLNDTLYTINNHAHALRTGIYMQGTSGGALITFDNANLYNMMQVRLWGNGYGASPLDTIVQAYHYEYQGQFIQCKQHNNCAGLGACKWKIINGKIALWVPYLSHYSSLVIDAYETLPSVRPIPTTVELMDSEPVGTATVACTIV